MFFFFIISQEQKSKKCCKNVHLLTKSLQKFPNLLEEFIGVEFDFSINTTVIRRPKNCKTASYRPQQNTAERSVMTFWRSLMQG